jgi:CheY-like chemotaxis protein
VAGVVGRFGEKVAGYVNRGMPEFVVGDGAGLGTVLGILVKNAFNGGEVKVDARGEDGGVRFTVVAEGRFSGEKMGVARAIVRGMGGELHLHEGNEGEGSTVWFLIHFSREGAGKDPAWKNGDGVRGLRVLVAEDNEINRVVICDQLEQLGHTAVTVGNGGEALEALGNGGGWDAVLLDCQMPVMDGYHTVAAMRQREERAGGRTWVVAVTANGMAEEREACLRAGMDDFLTIPVELQELARALARIPARTPNGNAAVSAEKLAGLRGSKAVSGENLFEKMARLFMESSPLLLDEIDTALRQDDLPGAVRCAHKMGGGCSYFGAKALQGLCAELERLGRAGDHAGMRSVAPLVRQEYARVEMALSRREVVA